MVIRAAKAVLLFFFMLHCNKGFLSKEPCASFFLKESGMVMSYMKIESFARLNFAWA